MRQLLLDSAELVVVFLWRFLVGLLIFDWVVSLGRVLGVLGECWTISFPRLF